MAITDKTTGPWGLDQVYNKKNQGSIWNYQVGELYAWGYGSGGMLGLNGTASQSSPTQVGTDTTWSSPENGLPKATMGYGFTVIKSDGTLWGVGDNGPGLLGMNNRTDYSSPIQIFGGSGTDWKFLNNPEQNYGSGATYAIKNDGTAWASGSNTYGQLGQNDRTTRSSPIQIPGTTWDNIASAGNTSGLIKTDGTLWTVGRNVYGNLGINNRTNYSSPVQVPGTTWRTVYAGNYGLAAIKTDGTLWSWGYNSYGSLGQNNLVKYSSPTQIPGTTWEQFASGNANGFGLKTDGTLWAWGYNDKGALGVLDSHDAGNNYSSPVQVPGTNWSLIAPTNMGSSAFALKSDNTLWSWGDNSQGTLGQNQGPGNDRSSPTQIPGTTWIGVVGGFISAIGFKKP